MRYHQVSLPVRFTLFPVPVEIRLLTTLLSPDRIRVPLGSHSRHALLRELVELALPDAPAETIESVFQSVLAREAIASTAVGAGLAVPHGRTDDVPRMMMAAGLVEGVDDYDSPDDHPVRVCFLVLTPLSEGGGHLQVLARLARLMRDDARRGALLSAPDAPAFFDVLRASEAA